jgi:hypothetical protein
VGYVVGRALAWGAVVALGLAMFELIAAFVFGHGWTFGWTF